MTREDEGMRKLRLARKPRQSGNSLALRENLEPALGRPSLRCEGPAAASPDAWHLP